MTGRIYTLEEIAKDAGTTIPSIAHHFNKGNIILPKRNRKGRGGGYNQEDYNIITEFYENWVDGRKTRHAASYSIPPQRLETEIESSGNVAKRRDMERQNIRLSYAAESLGVDKDYLKSIIPKVLGITDRYLRSVSPDQLDELKEFLVENKPPEQKNRKKMSRDTRINDPEKKFTPEDIAEIYNANSPKNKISPEQVEAIAGVLGVEFINNHVESGNAGYIFQELCGMEGILYSDYFKERFGETKDKEKPVIINTTKRFYLEKIPEMLERTSEYLNSKISELGLKVDNGIIEENEVDTLIANLFRMSVEPAVLNEKDPEKIITISEIIESDFGVEQSLNHVNVSEAINRLRLPLFWTDSSRRTSGISELGIPYIIDYFRNQRIMSQLKQRKKGYSIKNNHENPKGKYTNGMRSFSY